MRSSRGRSPHHLGLRVNTIRCLVRSNAVTTNGPADGPGPDSCAVLNASAVAVLLLGSSMVLPADMPRHSAYGLAKVMTACWSLTPGVPDLARSLPLVPAIAKFLSIPLVAWIWLARSSQLSGVPSDQIAFGLMV